VYSLLVLTGMRIANTIATLRSKNTKFNNGVAKRAEKAAKLRV